MTSSSMRDRAGQWEAMPTQTRPGRELHKTKWLSCRGITHFPHVHAQSLAHDRQFIDKSNVDHAEGVLEQFCHFSSFSRTDGMYRLDRAPIPCCRHFATGFCNAAHYFWRVDCRPVFAAWIHTFRRECKEPVLANRQSMLGAKFWKKNLPRRSGIRG